MNAAAALSYVLFVMTILSAIRALFAFALVVSSSLGVGAASSCCSAQSCCSEEPAVAVKACCQVPETPVVADRCCGTCQCESCTADACSGECLCKQSSSSQSRDVPVHPGQPMPRTAPKLVEFSAGFWNSWAALTDPYEYVVSEPLSPMGPAIYLVHRVLRI